MPFLNGIDAIAGIPNVVAYQADANGNGQRRF
jgi:hypothetical protein